MPNENMESPEMQQQYRLEMKRRLRNVRKALGLEQSELAALLGVGQPEISKWENPKKKYPISFDGVQRRLAVLAESFRGRGRAEEVYAQVNPAKVPQSFSPLRVTASRFRIEVAWLFSSELTFIRSYEEVKHRYPDPWEASLSYVSKAPWVRSELLALPQKSFRYGKHISAAVPGDVPGEAVKADLLVHGREFVRRIREEWSGEDRRTTLEAHWRRGVAEVGAQHFSNLILAELSLEQDLTPEALRETERLALPGHKTRLIEHRMAMELLSRVFELSRLEDGTLDLAKLQVVAERTGQYREVPTKPFEMLAEMERLKADALSVLDSVLITTGGES